MESEKMTSRLNISLITEEDKEAILLLRDALERKIGKRLSYAEVVRHAIHNQAKIENKKQLNKF